MCLQGPDAASHLLTALFMSHNNHPDGLKEEKTSKQADGAYLCTFWTHTPMQTLELTRFLRICFPEKLYPAGSQPGPETRPAL